MVARSVQHGEKRERARGREHIVPPFPHARERVPGTGGRPSGEARPIRPIASGRRVYQVRKSGRQSVCIWLYSAASINYQRALHFHTHFYAHGCSASYLRATKKRSKGPAFVQALVVACRAVCLLFSFFPHRHLNHHGRPVGLLVSGSFSQQPTCTAAPGISLVITGGERNCIILYRAASRVRPLSC